jgi:hypothetical protein
MSFGQFMNRLSWKSALKGSFGSEFGANMRYRLGVFGNNRVVIAGGELPVQAIDKAPIFEEFLFGNFSNIKGDGDLV